MLVRPLTPELKEKAAVELNETPKKLEDGIKHLKEWISKQPHLRARTDDQWLAAFLRGCKHSQERAKEKLDLYYSLRTISPDMFSLRPKNQKFKDLLQTGAVLVLPKLASSLDPRVIIVRPGLYDPYKFLATEFFSFSHIFQQYSFEVVQFKFGEDLMKNLGDRQFEIMYLEDDPFMVSGSVGVLDLEGITMAHFLQMTPTVMKKLVIAGQDASPLRVKSLHFVNSSPAFEKLFNIVVKLLNDKHKKRLHVYSKDISVLHQFIPIEILPEEFGGHGGTTQEIIDYWLKKFDQYGDWFDEDLKYGTDETKRPGKPKTAENMFGVQGSFRQLEVD